MRYRGQIFFLFAVCVCVFSLCVFPLSLSLFKCCRTLSTSIESQQRETLRLREEGVETGAKGTLRFPSLSLFKCCPTLSTSIESKRETLREEEVETGAKDTLRFPSLSLCLSVVPC